MTEENLLLRSAMESDAFFGEVQLAEEGILTEPMYYRQAGLRRPVQLVAPTLRPVAQLQLPREAMLHHIPASDALYGIDQDEPILANEKRMIPVEHVFKLTSDKGPPRPRPVAPMSMVREYRKRNRRTRPVMNMDSVLRDPVTPVIINYGLLPHLYRYTQTFLAGYNKWFNIQMTQVDNLNHYLKTTKRNQYIPATLPTRLPSRQQLERGSKLINRTVLQVFNEPSALVILELWKWLGEERTSSVFGKIAAKDLNRVNFIWEESGRWFVMNLGLLDSWRKSETNKQASITPAQMQRRFLRLLMFLFEARTVHGAANDVVTADPEGAAQRVEANDAKTMQNPYVDVVKHPTAKIEVQTDAGKRTLKLREGLDIDHLPEGNHVEETPANIAAIDEAITRDIDALDHHFADIVLDDGTDDIEIVEREKPQASEVDYRIEYQARERTLADGIMDQADFYAKKGLLSSPEYRRLTALSTAYQKLPDPFGRVESLEAASKVSYEELKIRKDIKIPDSTTILDKSLLSSTLFDYEPRYISDILHKHIAASVLAVQSGGVAVTGFTVEDVEDAMGHYENYAVQLTPVRGKPSTVHFRLPKIQPDGTYRSNGTRVRLRKQRIDVPIRKFSPSKVALTSYFSKTFVSRSEKKVHDYPAWVTNQIAARGLDVDDSSVSDIMLADVFDSYDVVPRIYSILAQRFRSFKSQGIEFFLDYQARHAHFGIEWVQAAEKQGWTVIGRKGNKPVVVDGMDALYMLDGEKVDALGSVEQVLDLKGHAPIEMAEVKVLNKQLPLGVIMAYLMGLDQLIEVTRANPRRVPSGQRLQMSESEFAVRFEDEALVFSRDNRVAAMLFSGFNVYEEAIRNYSSNLFNSKDIYANVLEQNRVGQRYLREAELMLEMFVDPMTRQILEEMKEPTDLIGLYLRSCELLMTDWSPDETDARYMRIRGYEKMAGSIYSELVRAIRGQRARGSVANAKIELPPYAVWQTITQDSANKLVEESNPIHNLKEKEEVTYSGTGGRSARSMVRRTRVFHDNDVGLISESTKDSGDVAITTFLTADPNITDMYGTSRKFDADRDGAASLLSTSALISPAADRDDGKRVNFIGVQLSSSTFTQGYTVSPLRTGAEAVVAHRTDDLFAAVARKPGHVIKVTDRAINIEHDDGSVSSYQLGRRFGTAAGSVFPHQVNTGLKEGDKVAEGDCVAYNSHYFALDPFNDRQAILKAGVMATTMLVDGPDTFEDSSAISAKMAERMMTQITHIRDITLSFDQAIHNLVSVGDIVESEDILCTIEDGSTASSNLFDDKSLDTLRLIAANTPRAKYPGRVEQIEVFYHGDIEDISPSLQDVALQSDRERKRLARDLGKRYTSGRVDESMRLGGNPLPYDNLVIRVYITENVGTNAGDKGVFGNQLKTIFRRVYDGKCETLDGTEIDAMFSYTSVNNRIVDSALIMGMSNTLLKVLSTQMAEAYFSAS